MAESAARDSEELLDVEDLGSMLAAAKKAKVWCRFCLSI